MNQLTALELADQADLFAAQLTTEECKADWRHLAKMLREQQAEILAANEQRDRFAGLSEGQDAAIQAQEKTIARLVSALHAAMKHPDWSYLVCPAGKFVQAVMEPTVEDGEWEMCEEATLAPGDECWRRRKQP